jgi:predicted transcriptional regulator
MSTSLKLPDALKRRVARAAKAAGKSPHAYMIEAIERQTEQAEKRREFVEEALAAEKDTLQSGMGYDADQFHAHIRRLAAGRKSERPKARSWRG